MRCTRMWLILAALVVAMPGTAQMWLPTRIDKPDLSTSSRRDFKPVNGDCSDLHGWLPSKFTEDNVVCFWGKPEAGFLTANDFVTTPGTVSNTTEILADFSGPVRLAASSAVVGSTKTSDTNSADRNLNLLRANGGNLALTGVYPLFLATPRKLLFEANVLGRAAANVSALGGASDANESSTDFNKLNGNTEVSAETRTRLLSDAQKFRFFLYTRTGAIVGSKVFRETIGSERSLFWIGEAGLSARVGEMFTVGVTWDWYSDKRIKHNAAAFHIALSR